MSEEITKLHSLKNTSRPFVKAKLLGRGVGCKKGKTCGRGHKGDKSRSGYKRRYGHIGSGVPLHRKVPTRGFSHADFKTVYDVINLEQIERIFKDGETVSIDSLREKGFIKNNSSQGLKILGKGTLSKKVKFDVVSISESAKEKLKSAGISF